MSFTIDLPGKQGEAIARSFSADNYQLIVHVDESALKNDGGESDLPIESVHQLKSAPYISEPSPYSGMFRW